MAKIKAVIEVREDGVRGEAGIDDLAEAIRRELGWLHDSGMDVENWEFIDQHH